MNDRDVLMQPERGDIIYRDDQAGLWRTIPPGEPGQVLVCDAGRNPPYHWVWPALSSTAHESASPECRVGCLPVRGPGEPRCRAMPDHACMGSRTP